MYQIVLLLHVLICIGIIALVLVQHGKGADMGASFGSGASNTVFGSQGSSSFLVKMTTTLAAAFFVCCLILGGLASYSFKQQNAGSVMSQILKQQQSQSTIDANSKEEAVQNVENND